MNETLKTEADSPQHTNMFAISSPMYFGRGVNFGWGLHEDDTRDEFEAPIFERESFEPFIEKHLKDNFYDSEQYFETASTREAWLNTLEHHKATIERDWKAYETFVNLLKDFLDQVKSEMRHNPYLMSVGFDAAPVYQTRWEQISKNLDFPFRKIHSSLIEHQKRLIDLEDY
jgi:hypothetical protein